MADERNDRSKRLLDEQRENRLKERQKTEQVNFANMMPNEILQLVWATNVVMIMRYPLVQILFEEPQYAEIMAMFSPWAIVQVNNEEWYI